MGPEEWNHRVPEQPVGSAGGSPPVLFVLAHQDDEIAYMGRLKKFAGSAQRVHIIWITDGAYSVPASVRRQESLSAMRLLGLDYADSFDFWDFPDGFSMYFPLEVVDKLTERIAEIGPKEVYTTAYEGGHPDHDFAHFASVTASYRQERPPIVFEAPLYNRYGCRMGRFGRFIPAETPTQYTMLDLGDRKAKLKAILQYDSQLWIALLPGFLFGGMRALADRELYRRVPSRDYLKPPHQGRLLYEDIVFRRMLGFEYPDFARAVRRVQQGA